MKDRRIIKNRTTNFQIWFISYYPRSDDSLLKVQNKLVKYYLRMQKIGVEITFSFNLCTISL